MIQYIYIYTHILIYIYHIILYYELERGYSSTRSLYERAREEAAVTTLEEVKNFTKK